MVYPYDNDEDEILRRLQQVLEPPRARELRREGEPIPVSPDAIAARDREDEINSEWRKELFPEGPKDDWRNRTRQVLRAVGDRLRQPPDDSSGNEWLGAVGAGARAWDEAPDKYIAQQQGEAKGKLAALATAAQVESRADKNTLSYENMLLKYGNLERRNAIYEQDVRSKILDRQARRTAAVDKADKDADARLLRKESFDLRVAAGQRAALALWKEMVEAEGRRIGIIGGNPLDIFPDQAAIDAAKMEVNAYGERLKGHPLFREVFAMGLDPDNPPQDVPQTTGARGTWGRGGKPGALNPDWDLNHVMINKQTGKKVVLNKRTHTWDPM